VQCSMIIQLATSLVFLASAFYGPSSTTTTMSASVSDSLKNNPARGTLVQPLTLEDHVKEYFKDDPVMAEIAKCESNYRHFTESGNVIRGRVNKDDVGVMQINEYYHADRAKNLGYDLETLSGNMAYAKWLYETEGVKPWVWSSKCWSAANINEIVYVKK